MSYTIRPISVEETRRDGQYLLQAHYQELTRHKARVRLEPDWKKYQDCEAAGLLVSLGIWDGTALIGYSVFILTPHIHYKAVIYAMNDVVFLREDYRNGIAGVKLLKASEAECERRGADKIVWHAKPDTALAEILPRMGYGLEEHVFSKMVGG